MGDRRGAPLQQRIDERRFGDPDVRDALDELRVDELEQNFGPPRVSVTYAEPRGYWAQGDGRPVLADDDPVVMQLIGRCAAWRARNDLPVLAPPSRGAIHPESCQWDDYPTGELLKALDWATWSSRYVISELLIWRNHDDASVVYIREGERTGTYGNPRYAEFFGLPRKERAARIDQLPLGMAS